MIADNTWAAMQGRKKLKVDWDLGANADLRFRRLQETRCKRPRARPAKSARNDGDVDAAFAQGGESP